MSVRIGDYPKTADTDQNFFILFTLIEYFIVVNKTGLVFKFLIIPFLRGIKYNRLGPFWKIWFLWWTEISLYSWLSQVIHQSIPFAPSPLPPRLLRGICLPCQSREWVICKFCAARGPGICQPQGQPRTFDTHAVSYQNITTRRILLEIQSDCLICQGSTGLLYKFLPANLGVCEPTFHSFYTTHLRWNSTIYHTDLGRNVVFHNFSKKIALGQYSGRSIVGF